MQPHVDPPDGGDETLRRLRAVVEGLRLTGSGELLAALAHEEAPTPADDTAPGTNEHAQECAEPLP